MRHWHSCWHARRDIPRARQSLGIQEMQSGVLESLAVVVRLCVSPMQKAWMRGLQIDRDRGCGVWQIQWRLTCSRCNLLHCAARGKIILCWLAAKRFPALRTLPEGQRERRAKPCVLPLLPCQSPDYAEKLSPLPLNKTYSYTPSPFTEYHWICDTGSPFGFAANFVRLQSKSGISQTLDALLHTVNPK